MISCCAPVKKGPKDVLREKSTNGFDAYSPLPAVFLTLRNETAKDVHLFDQRLCPEMLVPGVCPMIFSCINIQNLFHCIAPVYCHLLPGGLPSGACLVKHEPS